MTAAPAVDSLGAGLRADLRERSPPKRDPNKLLLGTVLRGSLCEKVPPLGSLGTDCFFAGHFRCPIRIQTAGAVIDARIFPPSGHPFLKSHLSALLFSAMKETGMGHASLRTLTTRLGKSLAAAGEKPRAAERERHWLCVSQLDQRLHVRVCFVEAVDVNDVAIAWPDFFKLVRSPLTARKDVLRHICKTRMQQPVQKRRIERVHRLMRGQMSKLGNPQLSADAAPGQAVPELMYNGLGSAELIVFVDERNFHGRRPSKIFRMFAFKTFPNAGAKRRYHSGSFLKLMQMFGSVSRKNCQ